MSSLAWPAPTRPPTHWPTRPLQLEPKRKKNVRRRNLILPRRRRRPAARGNKLHAAGAPQLAAQAQQRGRGQGACCAGRAGQTHSPEHGRPPLHAVLGPHAAAEEGADDEGHCHCGAQVLEQKVLGGVRVGGWGGGGEWVGGDRKTRLVRYYAG